MTKEELEKENAELKANNQFLNNLIREKEQRGLEIQEDLLRENEKLKEQCLILADCNTCHSTCKNENVETKKQSNLLRSKTMMEEDVLMSYLRKIPDDLKLGEEREVVCVCGGKLFIGKSKLNGHIRMACNKCKFQLMQ